MFDNVKLGRYLRSKRERTDTRARRIARVMGISPQFLSDLEGGKKGWTPELMESYLRSLRDVVAGRTPL